MNTESIPLTHKCSKCGFELPLDATHFPKNKTKKSGFDYRCKQCALLASKQYYRENNAQVKARAKEYRDSHVEQRKAYNINYYQENKETAKQRSKQWRDDNPSRAKELNHRVYTNNKEHHLAKSRQWAQNNPDKIREIKQRWIDNNPDRRKEVGRNWAREHPEQRINWRAENPEAYRIANKRGKAKRRALMNEAEGNYTKEDLLALYAEQEGRCAYCGITLYWDIPGDIHLDHVVALTRGGSNWPDNLALTCASCNSSKQEKSYEEWIIVRGW